MLNGQVEAGVKTAFDMFDKHTSRLTTNSMCIWLPWLPADDVYFFRCVYRRRELIGLTLRAPFKS